MCVGERNQLELLKYLYAAVLSAQSVVQGPHVMNLIDDHCSLSMGGPRPCLMQRLDRFDANARAGTQPQSLFEILTVPFTCTV